MARIPILMLVVLPFVEIWLMIWVGQMFGAGTVVLALLTAGVMGWWLFQQAGSGTLLAAHACLRCGESPGRELLHGALRMLGALLLMIPGFLSDGIGLLLLIPWFRLLIAGVILSAFQPAPDDTIIEGEVLQKQHHKGSDDVVLLPRTDAD
ncbi:MAG: FxsA family protein [Magnetococcales bacterium]|nr:FxsA family protein [Magnetococcales bacterium]